MQHQTVFTITFIGILVYISYCNGDTCSCRCCSVNGCTPILQGTIFLSPCSLLDCQSACTREYPTQCKHLVGSLSFGCSSDIRSTSNWLGIFATSHECDTRSCCCPIGNLIISRANANNIRIRGQFGGRCYSQMPPLDLTIAEPSVYTVQGFYLDQSIQVTLRQDSRSIQIDNPAFPSCSETAKRSGSASTVTVHLSFISLLLGSINFKLFII
ncbi:hypothetical protein I4U23_016684 [Adineta vaga]|nr:hypothetical protein I4U23_016684 [Adineta vaga]